MRAIWTGSISFGLVNIQISLYSATESRALNFRLLHKKNHEPIHYKRWCDSCKKEVDWGDVVKGLELSKGEYYILDKEELESLKPEKSDTIDIIEFIDREQLDPIYFSKHYFLGPQKKDEKTYFLFREILQNSAKVAIGKFILREKEYVCAISSYQKGLLLTTLNYAYEIRNIDEVPNLESAPKLRKEEMDLAKQLIDKLYHQEWDITRFKDTFAEELKKLLKKKKKGEVVEIRKEGKATEKKEENLVKALKASLK